MHFGGKTGQGHRFPRIIRPRSGYHFHPARRAFHRETYARFLLIMGQGGRFTGTSARHQSLRSVFDLKVNYPAESVIIDLQIVLERSHQRHVRTVKHTELLHLACNAEQAFLVYHKMPGLPRETDLAHIIPDPDIARNPGIIPGLRKQHIESF